MAIYFDHSLVFVCVVIGCKCSSAKEAKMRVITVAMRKAKDFEILKARIFLNAMGVIKALKGVEDWPIENLVDDILGFSCFFKKNNFSFIPRKLNRAVNCLAKFSFERGESFEWFGSFVERF